MSGRAPSSPSPPAERGLEHGRLFWAATAVGWAVMTFGVWTLLQRSGSTRPPAFAAWFVGLALAHDLVLAPILAGLAVALGPRIPPRLRVPVVAGLVVSGALVLVSLPPLLGERVADDPSVLPRDYGVGLLVALAVTWVTVVAVAIVVRRRSSRPGRAEGPS
jgi:hypothetical protein